MSLPPAFLDELRMRTTLSSVIQRHTKLQKAGREWKACCPFHKEKTPSFTVNDEKGFYHCFGCGAHGDAIRFLTETRGLPFIDAVKELADQAGMQVPAPDPRARERQQKSASLRDVVEAAQNWYVEQLHSSAGAEARAYLEERGISEATQRAFGLGFAPDARGKLEEALKEFGRDKLIEAGLIALPDDGRAAYDRFRSRLMFPIRDRRGRVIAFSGRIIGDGKPKYLNSPDTPIFDKGHELYNFDRAGPASRDARRIIVVEGQMDVIALDQAGFTEAVAPLGTALTENQLALLWRIEEAPILCFDGDAAGQKAAMRAVERAMPALRPDRTLRFVTLPPGEDPDDMIRSGRTAELGTSFDKPTSLDRFLWESEHAQANLESPTGRAAFKQRLAVLAASVGNNEMSQEFGKAFRDQFWRIFGWSAGNVKSARSSLQPPGRRSILQGVKVFHRAVLFGLSRYPHLITEYADQIQRISIDDTHLRSWRTLLISAAFSVANLDDEVIDTILLESDLEPKPVRNIHRDLAFSFFRQNGDREVAERDLIAVVTDLAKMSELEDQISRVNAEALSATEADASDVWMQTQQEKARLKAEQTKIHEHLESIRELAA